MKPIRALSRRPLLAALSLVAGASLHGATVSTAAPALRLGTNIVAAGTITEFNVPLTAKARLEAARVRRRGDVARGALALPPNFDLHKSWPLLIVSVPSGGSSVQAVPGYTNVAFAEGWVVLAGDGPRLPAEEDTVQLGWAMLSSVVEFVARSWPSTRQWPVACAGFSGGAKRSAAVAAAMMHEHYRVEGVFMGGCNEDRATLGLQLFQPGDHFKLVPMFLSNGSTDPIAGPTQAAAVRESMEKSGFKVIRAETYDGGHRPNPEHLRQALRWFRSSH